MSKRSVICEAVRTPIGRFQGGLAAVRAPRAGRHLRQGRSSSAPALDPAKVDEVIMGNVCQAGLQQNPARQAAIFGGVPATVSAMTINKVCGSGLKAVALADQAIRAGDKRLRHRRRHGEHEPDPVRPARRPATACAWATARSPTCWCTTACGTSTTTSTWA